MPPLPSQKGTGKKGSGVIRQRSRNTTPSSGPPPSSSSSASASGLPRVEIIETEFLELKLESIRAVTFEEPAGSANWVTAEAKAGLLNEEITDVAFTSATHKMFPGGLEALFAEHRFGDAVPLGAHWAHKYLVDLDGMGYSGRFMAFLESDSVPVKSSVYKEFYSDWIE